MINNYRNNSIDSDTLERTRNKANGLETMQTDSKQCKRTRNNANGPETMQTDSKQCKRTRNHKKNGYKKNKMSKNLFSIRIVSKISRLAILPCLNFPDCTT